MRKLRFVFSILVSSGIGFAADFAPALQWVKTLGGSGVSTIAAAKADSNGNFYIVGSTTSIDLPVKAAAQPNPGGSPLVRIDAATGASQKLYAADLSAASSLAADPSNPGTLYATVANSVLKSSDSGATWSLLSVVGPAAALRLVTVDPVNSSVLYAATNPLGLLKSSDGGHTWTAINNGIAPYSGNDVSVIQVWVDPKSSQVVFADSDAGLVRSADGGASWTVVRPGFGNSLAFDPFHPGTVYLSEGTEILKSTDHGQTFVSLPSLPDQSPISALVADPIHPGVLFAGSYSGIFQSLDSGITWELKTTAPGYVLAADPNKPILYATAPLNGIVKTTDGFTTSMPIGLPETSLGQIVVAGPYVYEVAAPSNDVFAAKLDPDGNIVYTTYFGGSSGDTATAIALGADGSLYVTGTTSSVDFPTTEGVYAPSGSNFLFKLKPDGSLDWSTAFADGRTTVQAIALDSAGHPYIGGSSAGGLPTTPGAYQTQFQQTSFCEFFARLCIPGPTAAFVTKFDAQASRVLYSTYVPTDSKNNTITVAQTLVIDPFGHAWFGGQGDVVELNSTGSDLLTSTAQNGITISALTIDSSLNVYATGTAASGYNAANPGFVFPATPGAFQSTPQPATPLLPSQFPPGGGTDAFVIKWDSSLLRILAATLLGGEMGDSGDSIAVDHAGDVFVSGETDSRAFPVHAPFQMSFSSRAGFVAAFDASLSHLLFSTYLGDERPFDAHAVAPDGQGNVLIAGATLGNSGAFYGGEPGQSYTISQQVFVNKIALPSAPTVRLDGVQNFASRLGAPIAPGEPILAVGSGFGPDARFVIDGLPLTAVSGTATALAAVLPDDAKTAGAYQIQVQTGGSLSNPVYVPAAPASPAIFSVDGTGLGQGYILNSDGTLNSPSNPAAPGEPITIFATGVGAYSLTDGYAVAALPPSVFVDGFYANGIAAVEKPVAGLPGNVYQLSVYVPDPAKLVSSNPNLLNFKFPPQVGVKLVVGPVGVGNPDSSNFISQDGLVLNVK